MLKLINIKYLSVLFLMMDMAYGIELMPKALKYDIQTSEIATEGTFSILNNGEVEKSIQLYPSCSCIKIEQESVTVSKKSKKIAKFKILDEFKYGKVKLAIVGKFKDTGKLAFILPISIYKGKGVYVDKNYLDFRKGNKSVERVIFKFKGYEHITSVKMEQNNKILKHQNLVTKETSILFSDSDINAGVLYLNYFAGDKFIGKKALIVFK